MSTTPLNILVFHGSCRTTRLSVPLQQAIVKKLKVRGHKVTLFDAATVKFPVLEKPYHHYGLYGDTEKPPAWLQEWNDRVVAADAFVILDGEYNHGPTPGILNLIDHFYGACYKHKPAAICSYSYTPTAGVRSAYALRNVLSEVGMITCPTMFAAGGITTIVNEDGEFSDPAKNGLFESVANELEWYGAMLKQGRATGLPVKL